MDRAVKLIDLFDIKSVRFEQSDVYGIPHCKLIPVKHFRDKAIHGQNFCLGYLSFNPHGEPIDGTGFGEEIHYEDAVCFPDLATFQVLPWCKKTARVLVEGVYEGKVVEAYPRVIARRQLERLEEMGYSLFSAHEFEFYLLDEKTKEPVDRSTNANATSRLFKIQDFTQDVLEGLPAAGVDVEFVGTESATGQIEITYRPEFGIRAADNGHTYKSGIKEIAQKHGYMASFMSKPWADKPGSSAHFCHSLWDVSGEKPLLYDASQPLKLSAIGQHWVAGLHAHAGALALLMGPTINCLKRYKPFSFAPSNATWGMDNRTCAFRVKIQGGRGTYIENRMGASACNPYISLAATVAAGIDGIINRLPLPERVIGDAYKDEDIPPLTPKLPNTMQEAIDSLLADEVITSSLGHDFIKCFVAGKRNEIKLENAARERGDEEEKWERDYFFEVI
ncbi:lengsin-like [Diadema setosum]|uniref:lengsin-like n=1 Tax=Diadema setosum TaxID=31175 RepID=UPI003B3A7892